MTIFSNTFHSSTTRIFCLRKQFLFFDKTSIRKKKCSFDDIQIRKTVLPDWVSVSIFSKIKHYIETQDISVIDIYNPEEVQKVLWLGDLLFLENFQ